MYITRVIPCKPGHLRLGPVKRYHDRSYTSMTGHYRPRPVNIAYDRSYCVKTGQTPCCPVKHVNDRSPRPVRYLHRGKSPPALATSKRASARGYGGLLAHRRPRHPPSSWEPRCGAVRRTVPTKSSDEKNH